MILYIQTILGLLTGILLVKTCVARLRSGRSAPVRANVVTAILLTVIPGALLVGLGFALESTIYDAGTDVVPEPTYQLRHGATGTLLLMFVAATTFGFPISCLAIISVLKKTTKRGAYLASISTVVLALIAIDTVFYIAGSLSNDIVYRSLTSIGRYSFSVLSDILGGTILAVFVTYLFAAFRSALMVPGATVRATYVLSIGALYVLAAIGVLGLLYFTIIFRLPAQVTLHFKDWTYLKMAYVKPDQFDRAGSALQDVVLALSSGYLDIASSKASDSPLQIDLCPQIRGCPLVEIAVFDFPAVIEPPLLYLDSRNLIEQVSKISGIRVSNVRELNVSNGPSRVAIILLKSAKAEDGDKETVTVQFPFERIVELYRYPQIEPEPTWKPSTDSQRVELFTFESLGTEGYLTVRSGGTVAIVLGSTDRTPLSFFARVNDPGGVLQTPFEVRAATGNGQEQILSPLAVREETDLDRSEESQTRVGATTRVVVVRPADGGEFEARIADLDEVILTDAKYSLLYSGFIPVAVRDLRGFGFSGVLNFVNETIQIEPDDQIFVGADELTLATDLDGGWRLFGTSSYISINGEVLNNTLLTVLPAEITAGIIGGIVSLVIAFGWRRLSGR